MNSLLQAPIARHLGPADARQMTMNAIDATWADDNEKRVMRDEFNKEFDRLDAQLVS